MQISTQPSAPPAPSKEELQAALKRYRNREAYQDARVADAKAAVQAAEAAAKIARDELDEALAARQRLDAAIADLSTKIGA